MVEKPDEQRRYIKRTYNMAELRLRRIFDIHDDEMICEFIYDKSNSKLVLTTLKEHNKKIGDI